METSRLTRTFAHRSLGIVMLLVMLCGLVQAVYALRNVVFEDLPSTAEDWRVGRLAASLEKDLVAHLPGRQLMIGLANVLRYQLTGATGERVRLGRDDWLFLADEMRFYPDAEANFNLRLDLVRRVRDNLAAQGVTLVVALLPDKSRIYEDRMWQPYPLPQRERYDQALQQLQSAEVAVVDVRALWSPVATKQDVFYRTDTHWNQHGAALVADAVASLVFQIHQDLPAQKGFSLERSETLTERPGDLMSMLGFSSLPAYLRPAGDMEAKINLLKPVAETSVGLFDDLAVPVVLAGTSYSLRAEFREFLSAALGVDVLNVARDGGGFMRSLHAYLTDSAFQENLPMVIVWEIPERVLTEPVGEESRWLATLGSSK